jgi:amino acid adenylation domain-containing protein
MKDHMKANDQSLAKRIAQLSPAKRELLNRLAGLDPGNGTGSASIPRRQDVDRLPLSYSQRRLWFLDQLMPGNPLYNVAVSGRFPASIRPGVLEEAINEIVKRHESFRTKFHSSDEEPYQAIVPSLHIPLLIVDLRRLSVKERHTTLLDMAHREAQTSFQLDKGPLLRTVLALVDDRNQILFVTAHHIITDAWSVRLFFDELELACESMTKGLRPDLPHLPLQYGDFALWQRKHLTPEKLQPQINYWKEQLAGCPVLQLPTDRPRPSSPTFRGGYLPVTIPALLTSALRALSRQESVTLFMTLLTAFQCLLSRYTGEDDIVLGLPVAGRERPELEKIIGCFVNTLVIRTDTSGDPKFRELLQHVKRVTLDALANQDVPFELLVEALQPNRDLNRNPLFQATFQLFSIPSPVQQLEPKEGTSRFDLVFDLGEDLDGATVSGRLEYSRDLFDAETIERLASHYQNLLEAIVKDPDCRISRLPLLSKEERHQLLTERNATTAPYPASDCFHQLFEQQVRLTPDNIAVTAGAQRITYCELNRRANQLARHLCSLGAGPGILAGIHASLSIEMMVAILAVHKAGGGYVPLDPTLPEERLRLMVQDSGVHIILAEDQQDVHFSSSVPVLSLERDGQQAAGLDPGDLTIPQLNAELPAYVVYTSGSTGRPKGVLVPHRCLVNYLWWAREAYDTLRGQGSIVHSSLSFDLTITGLFTPLISGTTVHLVRTELGVQALAESLLAGSDFTLVKLTPAHLDLLAELIPEGDVARRTNRFIIGGENLDATSLAFWREHAPETILVNEYGPTETVVGCCTYQVDQQSPRSGGVPIGRPIANVRLYILDRYQQPVPQGVTGELYIGGAGVARGYLNLPQLTASTFLSDPFSGSSGDRLYRTGDLARYRTDGNIEYLGRVDRQTKIRGYRVELGEIEAAMASCPSVRSGSVIAAGEGLERTLVAFVRFEAGSDPDAKYLVDYLRTVLPAYMVPNHIVPVPDLPITRNGKIDYRYLEQLFAGGERGLRANSACPPATPAQMILTKIWEELLDTRPVGIHDNFFSDLGGHSLLAVRLVSRIRNAFVIDLPLRSIFEAPTIAELADYLTGTPEELQRIEKAAEVLLGVLELPEESAAQILAARASQGAGGN